MFRDLWRLSSVLYVLLRHGLFDMWGTSKFWNLFRSKHVSGLPTGVRLRLACEHLGPIFIKFGQVVSTRRDLIPNGWADELAKLQNHVPPFPSDQARTIIEKSLLKPIDEVYADFSEGVVASASVAQVYRAHLRNPSRQVAVKVLRPGIEKMIARDLNLMKTLATYAELFSKDGRRLRLGDVVCEFERVLRQEIDLTYEAAHASQLLEAFKHSSQLIVPRVYFDYSSKHVLTMDWMDGIPINQVERLHQHGVDLQKLSRWGVEIFFTQVFRDGFFHADMHPGNIFVAPDGRYIALDFGVMGHLSLEDKYYLAVNFLAFFQRDYHRVASAHIESGWVPPETNLEDLASAVRSVCEPFFQKPLADISFGLVLMRLFEVTRRFNIEVQPQLVLLQKTLLNVEGLGRQLDPDLNLWETGKPFLERWMGEQLGWRSFFRRIRAELPFWQKNLPSLPRRLHDITERLSHLHSSTPPLEHSRHLKWMSLFACVLGVLNLLALLYFVFFRN